MTALVVSHVRAPIETTLFTLGTITAGTYALSGASDNRDAQGTTSYLEADLLLVLAAPVTFAAGDFISVSVFEAADGGTQNYAGPGTASASSPSLVRATYWCPPVSIGVIPILGIKILPYSLKYSIFNKTSVDLVLASASVTRRSYSSF